MRIATYNLWNAVFNWDQRLAAAAETLVALDANVVCLQEAPIWATSSQLLDEYLQARTAHAYVSHTPYPETPRGEERPEGLGFLSKLPIALGQISWSGGADTENCWAVRYTVIWNRIRIGVTNVHLDWQCAECRERQIVRIVQELCDTHAADLDILCGDFNADGDTPLFRFLTGEQALYGHHLGRPWRDLALEWYAARGETPPVTLDFEHNPRWQSKRISTPSRRVDRIYLRSSRPDLTPRTISVGRFGTTADNSQRVVPSDHYGVYVDLEPPDPLGDAKLILPRL